MIPKSIAVKLDRRLLRAGITLSQIVGAFVAQLSTQAANEAQATIGALRGSGTKSAPRKRPGIASRNARPRLKARPQSA